MSEETAPTMTASERRNAKARETFIEVLRQSCNVTAACRASKIPRSTAYYWRNELPGFAKAWEDAEEEAGDTLEQVAWERATTGNSDRMLEILLKGHRPEKYTDRLRAEHTGRNGGPIQHEQVASDADAFTRTIAELAARAAAGSGASETET